MPVKKLLPSSNLKLKVGSEYLYFDVDEFMKNVVLTPQDQLMVATYIYPESDLFNVKTGQS